MSTDGSDHVGGISASVVLDDSGIDAPIRRVETGLKQLETRFTATANAAGLNSAAFRSGVYAIDQYGQRMATVQQSSSGAARGLLMLSQGIEDAQYGFSSIVNNIPGTLMAFGAGAGVAGAVSIAAVAVNQLTKNLDGLQDVFMGVRAKTPVAVMEELAKATKLTADQQERFNELKREEATLAGVQKNPGKEAAAQAKAFGEAVGEADGADLIKGLRTAMQKEGIAAKATPMEEAFVKIGEGTGEKLKRDTSASGWLKQKLFNLMGFKDAQGARDEVQSRLDEIDMGAITAMLGGAANDLGPSGDEQRRQLHALVSKHPGMFPKGFLGDVERMDPADRERQKKIEAEGAEYERKYQEDKAAGRLPPDQKQLEARGSRQRRLIEQDMAAKAKAERAALTAAEQADAEENDANYKKYIKDKLDRQVGLTAGERGSVDEETRQAEREMQRNVLERETGHMERMGSLGRRLREAMAPEVRNSMVMDSSSLNASVQASVTNGPSAEEKRLVEVRDAIKAIYDEMAKAQRPVKAGGR